MNKVFEKAEIGGLTLQNRIIRSATHDGLCDGNGRPLVDELISLYTKLIRGGAGAVITGFTAVSPNGRASRTNETGAQADRTVRDKGPRAD